MRIVFLKSAIPDIEWVRFYYRAVFPQGDKNARNHMRGARKLLAGNPHISRPSEAFEGARELQIARTPFKYVYRVTPTQIEIVYLWDSRRGDAV